MVASSNQPIVLVTGARGFTGRLLVAELMRRKRFTVYGLSQQTATSSFDYQADITQPDELRRVLTAVRPDYVIHLAAVSFVAHNTVADFYKTNLLGTFNLLQALSELDIVPKKILLASSAIVYGNPETAFVTEDTLPSPVNHYASSKLAMEYMARQWFDRLPIIITRPFNYIGPGQHPDFLVPKIIHHFKNRASSIQLGNTDVIRDFSDVEFVIDCYLQLLEGPVCSEIFNICSGEGHSIHEILAYLGELAGYQIKVESHPELRRKNEIRQLVGINSKLLSVIGKVSQPPFHETLRRCYLYEMN